MKHSGPRPCVRGCISVAVKTATSSLLSAGQYYIWQGIAIAVSTSARFTRDRRDRNEPWHYAKFESVGLRYDDNVYSPNQFLPPDRRQRPRRLARPVHPAVDRRMGGRRFSCARKARPNIKPTSPPP